MQQIYRDACLQGVRKVYRTRIMLIGHFAAGKTSVKRSLLQEPFVKEHLTTDGIEMKDQTCVVDVDTAVNWQKGELNHLHFNFPLQLSLFLITQVNQDSLWVTYMRIATDGTETPTNTYIFVGNTYIFVGFYQTCNQAT